MRGLEVIKVILIFKAFVYIDTGGIYYVKFYDGEVAAALGEI